MVSFEGGFTTCHLPRRLPLQEPSPSSAPSAAALSPYFSLGIFPSAVQNSLSAVSLKTRNRAKKCTLWTGVFSCASETWCMSQFFLWCNTDFDTAVNSWWVKYVTWQNLKFFLHFKFSCLRHASLHLVTQSRITQTHPKFSFTSQLSILPPPQLSLVSSSL